MNYQCVDCKNSILFESGQYRCLGCQRTYTTEKGVLDARPSHLSVLAREEAEYHDHLDEDAQETHQLSAWRNLFYHQHLWNLFQDIPKEAVIVEVGAGTGFDAEHIYRPHVQLILTDISDETLKRVSAHLNKDTVQYIAADGACLPFAEGTCDVVSMVAVWHHFEKPEDAIGEWLRVLKPGGRLIIGIEPNRLYFSAIKKLRPLLCSVTHMNVDEGSHADAEMEGFSYNQIQMYLRAGWQDVTIRPVWLLAGWTHYGLEFIYRVFHLKKRVHLPLWFEKIIVGFDELLFHIPGVRHLCWHWTVTARKI